MMLFLHQRSIRDRARVAITDYDAPIVGKYPPEDRIPIQYRPFPESQRAGFDFIAANELTNGFQEIEGDARLPLEKIELFRSGEDPRGKPLLDDDGPAAIL